VSNLNSPSEGPLAGIVVLDMTRILAGPWCTQMLADFGAEVIKIERPGSGDDTRSWGPPWMPDAADAAPGSASHAAYFAAANRNKKSVELDISSPAGQDAVRRLAAQADVFVENYKVGDLARYGLDYESLRRVNPRLIYCSITGYGQTGPYAHRPGYDFIFQGEAGLMSVTGEPDGKPGAGPQKVGVAVADLVTGMYASSAILAALQGRHLTGAGQWIDLALFDATLAFGANLAFNQAALGLAPRRYGNAHPVLVPYQVLKTRDGHLIVAAGNDGQWQRFCLAIQRPDLADDERYRTGTGRIRNRDSLMRELERIFLEQDTGEWLRRLEAHDIPHGRINSYEQALQHPQAVHRGMRAMSNANGRPVCVGVANPVRFSATPVSYRAPAPRLGEHTAEVLGSRLGVEPSDR